MKQTSFCITHVKAFYLAILDYRYTSLQVLKITPRKDGAVSFLIESDERDLFWLGVSYGIQMTFK